MLLLVRIDFLSIEGLYIAEIFVLDAYEDAKRRAMEVRESTLQILTPKEPVYD